MPIQQPRMNYEFIGKPDKVFPNLKTGAIYSLTMKEEKISIGDNFIDWFWGRTRPVITHPIRCPYISWSSFNQNWRKV